MPAKKPKMPSAPQSPIGSYFKSLPETTKTSLSNLMKEQRKVKGITDEAVKNSTRKAINDKIKVLLGSSYPQYRKARDATHPPTKKPSTGTPKPSTGMPKPPMSAAGGAPPMPKKKKTTTGVATPAAATPPRPATAAAVPGAAPKKKKKSPTPAAGL